MALKWLNEWLGDTGTPSDSIKALVDVSQARTPVRVEIENSPIRFHSRLRFRRAGMVVVEKPAGLNGHLAVGKFVRLRLPGLEQQELRLEVMISHFNLGAGSTAFICKSPLKLTHGRRKSDRYDCSRYANLRLIVGIEPFRLADVSATGCRVVLTGTQSPNFFPLGRELRFVRLMLSPDVKLDLVRFVPRYHRRNGIGCEFQVCPDGKSEALFKSLMERLAKD